LLVALLLPPLAATGWAAPPSASGAGCVAAFGVTDRWVELPPPVAPERFLAAGSFDGDPCSYLVADRHGEIFVTHDTGRHWSQPDAAASFPGDPPTCLGGVEGVHTQDLPDGVGYVFGVPAPQYCYRAEGPLTDYTSGLYVTSDYGRTMAPVAAFAGLSVEGVAVLPTNPLVRYALARPAVGFGQDSVFVSTDGGTSWNISPGASATLPLGPLAVGGVSGADAWIAGSADGDPSTADPRLVGGDAILWTSRAGSTTYMDIDHEHQIFAIATGLTRDHHVRVDIGTDVGVAVGTGGSAMLQTGDGPATALALDAKDARIMMAVRHGVPVRSVDDGRHFVRTPGLDHVGRCSPSLSRDSGPSSLFTLSLTVVGNEPPGYCPAMGIWIYRSGPAETQSAVPLAIPPPYRVYGPPVCSKTGGTAPVFAPGSTPNPDGLTMYVGQGGCIWAFDSVGRGRLVTTLRDCDNWSEGIALGFDDHLVVSCRIAHVLYDVNLKTGATDVIDDARGDVEGPSFDRFGDLFVVENDPAKIGGGDNTVYEYPYPQRPGETPNKVYSFGPNRFVEDTRIAPPGSPYAGNLFVLYAADRAARDSTDAIAMFRLSRHGWVRTHEFAHVPPGFVTLGMAFTPRGSLVLAADDGSGRLLDISADGHAYHYLASLAPTPTVSVAGQSSGPTESYSFTKVDITATGLILAVSSPLASTANQASAGIVRVSGDGTQLTPDFGAGFKDPTLAICGIAVPNVITGLPRLSLPNQPRSPKPTGRRGGLAMPPGTLGAGPLPPIAAYSAPGSAPAPAPQAQPDPVAQPGAQAQPNPQAGLMAQRQAEPQLTVAGQRDLQSDAPAYTMTVRRRDPTGVVVLYASALTMGAVAYGAARRRQASVASRGVISCQSSR